MVDQVADSVQSYAYPVFIEYFVNVFYSAILQTVCALWLCIVAMHRVRVTYHKTMRYMMSVIVIEANRWLDKLCCGWLAYPYHWKRYATFRCRKTRCRQLPILFCARPILTRWLRFLPITWGTGPRWLQNFMLNFFLRFAQEKIEPKILHLFA